MTALAFVIVGLLAVVVLVGLIQRTLDSTGIAVALSTTLSGLVGGLILRGRQDKGDS